MQGLVTKRMLYALFENKATQNEKQIIKEWLQDKQNEETFYYHLSVWEKEHLQFQPDLETAVSKFEQVLSGTETSFSDSIKTLHHEKANTSQWVQRWAIAASVLLFLSLMTYYVNDYLSYTRYETAFGVTRDVVLEDGTHVTLNANSVLKVPNDLAMSDSRDVWLKGEAFFHVTKRPQKTRFIVHTDNLNVEVLGTKFNVNTRRGNTEVVLDEGSVKLTSLVSSIEPVIMKPGDYVALRKSDSEFTKKVVETKAYNAWQSNRMVFEDAPLAEVAQRIEDHYGVKVKIDDVKLQSRLLTGTLPNDDLEVVLNSLETSHHIKITRNADLIIFE